MRQHSRGTIGLRPRTLERLGFRKFLAPAVLAACLAAAPAAAQFRGITLPPSGDNHYAAITQGIGLVRLTVEYNSPDVHGPAGDGKLEVEGNASGPSAGRAPLLA